MYFRCSDCYAATWVHGLDPGAESQTLKCRSCRRGFTVRASGNLGTDPQEQYETAKALAEGNGMDLPTAYSVMLGIITLEHAMVLRERGVPAHELDGPPDEASAEERGKRPAEADSSSPVRPALDYDPAFADAVADGYLSVQQAIERGERKRFVQRIIDRHHLPEELASMVADNRISLTTALRKDREEVAEMLRPVRAAVWKKALVAALGGAAVVAVGVYGMHVWSGVQEQNRKVGAWAETVASKNDKTRDAGQDEHPAATSRHKVAPRRVRILRDDHGRLLEIRGPDPSSVLLAYCANQEPANRFRALELTLPVPPSPGTKLGVFRDETDLGKRYAIKIRQTLTGRQWVAGDGQQPIAAILAPASSDGSASVPVVLGRSASDS